ncbi:MAG: hypothetical protein ABTQ25_17670 [Nitrosomonas ureae]
MSLPKLVSNAYQGAIYANMATCLIQAIADTFKQLVCSNAVIEYTLKIFNQARQNEA